MAIRLAVRRGFREWSNGLIAMLGVFCSNEGEILANIAGG